MTRGFGPEGERFSCSIFVIFVNRVVTMAVSAAVLALSEHSLRPAAPALLFSLPSVANVLASAAQYEALKYVSFPLQALAKCAKTVSGRWWRGCGAARPLRLKTTSSRRSRWIQPLAHRQGSPPVGMSHPLAKHRPVMGHCPDTKHSPAAKRRPTA